MAALCVTATANSIEVALEPAGQPTEGAAAGRISARPLALSATDEVSRALAGGLVTHRVELPGGTAATPLRLRLTLVPRSLARGLGAGAAHPPAPLAAEAVCPLEPRAAFHFLPAGQAVAVVVLGGGGGPAGASGGGAGALQPGDVVACADGSLGTVLAEPPRAEAAGREAPALREGAAGRVAGWLGLGGAGEAPGTAEVEVFREGCRAVAVETLGAAAAGAVRPLFRGAVLAFNTRTLPNPGVPDRVLRSLLLPRDTLGPWLLGLEGDYAYAASLDQSFVVRLLEHGLFVLPGDSQIFACPFPVKPYVFLLDEGAARGTRSTWRSYKMLRRYGKEFELSCNRDFQGHLALCGRYHEERGGTWISDELIEVLARIHEDPGNGIRMFCFELWDKRTRELAAASFGLSIGTFFHDFSTCCLVRDRRSAGSILAKAVGALLEDCGVALWYWGCKIGYMAEYSKHGAQEISRAEYYRRLRAASAAALAEEPDAAISAGRAAVPCWPGAGPRQPA